MPTRLRENRWTVDEVRCMDCDKKFGPGKVDRDVNRAAGTGNRVLLVWMPETCPNCRNLKVVEETT